MIDNILLKHIIKLLFFNEGQTEGNIHIIQINDITIGIYKFEVKGSQHPIAYIDVQ